MGTLACFNRMHCLERQHQISESAYLLGRVFLLLEVTQPECSGVQEGRSHDAYGGERSFALLSSLCFSRRVVVIGFVGSMEKAPWQVEA